MFKRFFTAFTIFAVLFFAWYFQSIQPVSRFDIPAVDFEVPSGSAVDKIANDLSSSKLIRSRIAFKITVIRLGIASRIQAGYFKLSPSMTTTEVAQALTHAYAKQFRVTIPEGLRSEEINLYFDKAFRNVKDNRYSSSEFAALTKDLDGNLFPDTYDFAPEASASDVVKRMTSRFDEVITELNISSVELPKIQVMASILEKEASSAEEMPIISGILYKRLSAGWPLQVDATIQYALGRLRCKQLDCDWWKNNLTKQDMQLNSPYNTYLNSGLPPKPISNPGKAALMAAQSPVETTAWFYLHDPKGLIHYAQSIEQHNRNVCLYLQKDCR